MSTVTADKTGKIVLLTYSLTATRCSTEAHLAGVPFLRSFDSFVLIKAFLVKKKGTKTAVLSRMAKLRSVVGQLHG